MTKTEFNKLSNKQIANLSNDDAMYLMGKFMKGFAGGDSSDISMRKKGGVIKPRQAAGGGMMDMRKTGMFYGGGMTKKKTY